MDQLCPPQANKGVKREGYPGAQRLHGRLPPRLFTYEVAHGSRIGIPVTLPKRHGSPREPGPGNPPPPLWGSRLHPLGVPGSASSPKRFPGSGPRLCVLPGRCGAPRTGSRAPGRGHRGGAPGHRRTCRALSAPGLPSGRRPPRGARQSGAGSELGTQVGFSRARRRGRPRNHSLGIRDLSSDPATYWANGCFSLRLLFSVLGKKIGVNNTNLRIMVRITDVNLLAPCLAPTK